MLARDWDGLLQLLDSLPHADWHDLHVWRQWPGEDAVAGGHPFAASVMLPVLVDLAKVYESVIGYAGPKSE
ncbi:MAG: hypothetical protein DLM71_09185 [Chloroflexi bacterium]|nr:MAG: hypothetical protein DLM71_09185 [Chloroflexota bacterium]